MSPSFMYPEQSRIRLPGIVRAVIEKLEDQYNQVEIGFVQNLYCFCLRDKYTGLYWSFFGERSGKKLSVFLDDEDKDIIDTFTKEKINLETVFLKDLKKWHPDIDVRELETCNHKNNH